MLPQSYVWSALAASCVALTTGSCIARLQVLYRDRDIATIAASGGAAAFRVLASENANLDDLRSEFELDLEARLGSWAAAPRVAARISMAIGVLFAALSLRTVLNGDVSAADEATTTLVDGVLQSVAPMLWGIVGLSAALTTDRIARARAAELRRAGAQLVGLMYARDGG